MVPSRDLPLWARALVGGSLVIVSWWFLSAEGIRGIVGSSVGVVVLGIVSASSLRGMHLPLGLWLDGPWRQRFSVGVVVVVSVVFSTVMVLADPQAPSALALIDRGAFGLVLVGVVGWGFTWSIAVQRGYVGWYAIATVAGLAPFFTGVLTQGLTVPDGLCLVSADPAGGCEGSALRVLGFLVPAYAAIALVTIELTFRRLLIGAPQDASALIVLASGLVYALWTAMVGPDAPLVAVPWWLALSGAVTAGCIYALGGSLLVSSLYTGLFYGSHMAMLAGRPSGAASGVGAPNVVMVVILAAGMIALVVQQRGWWRIPVTARS
jgi:hypothetical protein